MRVMYGTLLRSHLQSQFSSEIPWTGVYLMMYAGNLWPALNARAAPYLPSQHWFGVILESRTFERGWQVKLAPQALSLRRTD